MSGKQTPLRELRQGRATPYRAAAVTPSSIKTERRVQSARSTRTRQDDILNPNSARGILRRIARIEAKTTERRIPTPSVKQNTARSPVIDDTNNEDEQLVPRFSLEESIEEDDSDPLIAPTPSVLVDDSESDDEAQPTITFLAEPQLLNADLAGIRTQRSINTNQHDDSESVSAGQESEQGESDTFLTERGRRAVSEDYTRMSRYSFGSIRMSGFGSQLEIQRQSDRQEKMADLESDDADGQAFQKQDQETQDLRKLQNSSPRSVSSDGNDGGIDLGMDDFELPFDDDGQPVEEPSRVEMTAHQLQQEGDRLISRLSAGKDDLQDGLQDGLVGGPEDEIHDAGESDSAAEDGPQEPEAIFNHSTLLENVIAAAKPQKGKRQKLNALGNAVPNLPNSLMKKIIHQSQENAGKKKATLGKEHMKALEQASEWFFEQIGADLAAYSSHGKKRSRINTDDVLLLMKRQRIMSKNEDLKRLAKDWLP